MSKSIKKNFFYSSILTTSSYIFPFLTYPYISRVLGVNNIGICNFIDGIINYFILFSMMGIATIGIREVAKNKDNKQELNKTFSSIFILNTILTTIILIVYLIAIQVMPQLHQYKELAYIGIIKLIGNYLLVEWLFTGLEDFKYITKRTLTVKIIYVTCIFIFIRDTDDYPCYFLLSMLMVGINALFNQMYARRFITLTLRKLEFKPYFKSIMILGCYTILTSMYTSFNVAYLGFVTDTIQVGYYSTATKIYTILIALFTAFSSVMLPRMSSLLNEGKIDEFKQMVNKSTDALFTFSLPVIIMSIVFAPQIIHLIAGKGYEGAILPMRIVMPLMLVIGFAQIMVIQILMPLRKDNVILFNSILGASCGIILNLLLVRHWGATGSAMVWIISELVVTLSAFYYVHKYIDYIFPWRKLSKDIILHLPLLALYLLVFHTDFSLILQLTMASIIFIIYTFILQYQILKNEVIISMIDRILYKMTNKCKFSK